MNTHSSATALEETPHETETIQITISDALRRRAESVINDSSIVGEMVISVRSFRSESGCFVKTSRCPSHVDLLQEGKGGQTSMKTINAYSSAAT